MSREMSDLRERQGPAKDPLSNGAERQSASSLLSAGLDPDLEATPAAIDLTPILVRPSSSETVKFYSFGDFELLEEVARGGVGVVFRARQVSLNRTVALKFIHPGRLPGGEAVRRFKTEVELTARLEHPQIVPVYEVGECAGHPFFAMPLLTGGTLADRIIDPGSRLSECEVARLVAKVARGVHYAHERGIIHRDLKPGNILLDNHGEPHLTDFGLAKVLTEGADLTQTMTVLGTPHYMSPEQARGQAGQLTTASDLYSLGAILYELLTGQPPFVGGNLIDVLRRVAEEEPVPPSRLRQPGTGTGKSKIDPDLETICLKCLEKDPSRRYRSAAGLAADLEKWLRHEPIMARPTTTRELFAKWTRRNPALASVVGVALLVGIVGLAGVLTQWRRAVTSELKARENLYAAHMLLVQQALSENNLGRASDLLEQHRPKSRVPSAANRRPSTDLRGWEWRYFRRQTRPESIHTFTGHSDRVIALAFSGDGSLLASASADQTVRLWDTASRILVRTLNHPGVNRGVAFTSDGQSLITGCADGGIRLWDTESGQLTAVLTNGRPVLDLKLSPDGDTVAAGSDEFLDLWSLSQRRRLRSSAPFHQGNVDGVDFSPDGKTIAYHSRGRVVFRDPETGAARAEFVADPRPLRALAFSPNGAWLATSSYDSIVRIWDAQTFRELHALTKYTLAPDDLVFSPDSHFLAVGGKQQSISLWDTHTWEVVRLLRGHQSEVRTVAFSPDGRWLASGSKDRTVRLWATAPPSGERTGVPFSRDTLRYYLSPSGTWLVTVGNNGSTCLVWDTQTLISEPFSLSLELEEMSFSAWPNVAISDDSEWIASGRKDGRVEVYAGKERRLVEPFKEGDGLICGLAFAPRRSVLAIAWSQPAITVVDPRDRARQTRLPRRAEDVSALAFSSDANFLAAGYVDGVTELWDLTRRTKVAEFPGHKDWVSGILIFPDRRIIATAGLDGTVRLWNVTSQRELAVLRGQANTFNSLALSPDSRRLAAGGFGSLGGNVKIWDVVSRLEVAAFKGHLDGVWGLAFLPDGDTLLSVSMDSMRLWRAAPASETETAPPQD